MLQCIDFPQTPTNCIEGRGNVKSIKGLCWFCSLICYNLCTMCMHFLSPFKSDQWTASALITMMMVCVSKLFDLRFISYLKCSNVIIIIMGYRMWNEKLSQWLIFNNNFEIRMTFPLHGSLNFHKLRAIILDFILWNTATFQPAIILIGNHARHKSHWKTNILQ